MIKQNNLPLSMAFERDGYVILRSILNPAEVVQARRVAEKAYRDLEGEAPAKHEKSLYAMHVLNYPELFRPIFNERIVAALTEILEPGYSIVANFGLPRNQAGRDVRRYFGIRQEGWHVDSGAEGKQPYLLDPQYRFAKCGVYLQDNSAEWGGGIDVLRGGHRFPVGTSNPRLAFRIKTGLNQLGILMRGRRLDLKAGDAAIFDSRLPHRSTIPQRLGANSREDAKRGFITDVPPEKAKYVLYWDAGRRACADTFISFAETRARKELESGRPSTYAHFAALHYPDNFPPAFREEVGRTGVRIATLNEQSATEIRAKFNGAV